MTEVEKLKRWLHMSLRERLMEYLMGLAKADGSIVRPPVVADIALEVGACRTVAVRALLQLEREGLIVRKRHSTGREFVRIQLTNAFFHRAYAVGSNIGVPLSELRKSPL